MTQQVKKGDTVSVHYTGTLSNGEVFDSSKDREPLQFEVGAAHIIPGFQDAVIGMSVNEVKTVTIPAADAYGERTEKNVITLPRTQFPDTITPEVGMQLELQDDSGHLFPVVLTAFSDDTVTLDANHPLAGEDLTFEIELLEIGVELHEHHHHHDHHHHDHDHHHDHE